MSLLDKFKCFIKDVRDNYKYRKIKSCSLPFPFLHNWVSYDKNNKCYDVERSIVYALGDVAKVGLMYHYTVLGDENNLHSYSFDKVIKALYDYPQTFKVPDEYLDEYSKQELFYLKEVKQYLHSIKLKDIKPCKERTILDEKWDSIYNKKHKSIKDRLFMASYSRKCQKLRFKENLMRYSNEKA